MAPGAFISTKLPLGPLPFWQRQLTLGPYFFFDIRLLKLTILKERLIVYSTQVVSVSTHS